VLLHPGLNAAVHTDHVWFWSWAGELLLGGQAFAATHELRSLFSATVRAATAHVSHPDPYVNQLRRKATELIDSSARELLMHAILVTSYLVFPLLEAVCRTKCASHVTPTGDVTTPFKVTQSDGHVQEYSPTGPRKRCNSVSDLLLLLRDQLGDSDFSARLTEFGQHIATVSGMDGFDQIQTWRNASLHGESNYPTIGGTLLNLCILLCFHTVGPDYIRARDSVMERVRRDLSVFRHTGHRSSWEYYPPL
jgi:hypothetical protein